MKTSAPGNATGLTLIEVVAIVGLVFILLYLLLPRPHEKASATRIHCTNNLKQVGIAFRIWANDHEDQFPMWTPIARGGTKEIAWTGVVAPHFQVMSNELNTPKILICPADGPKAPAASFASGFASAYINYFIGLDAETTSPGSFLTGDDNLSVENLQLQSGLQNIRANATVNWLDTRHKKQGNVGLADGSVQGFSSSALRTALQQTGLPGPVIRLAVP